MKIKYTIRTVILVMTGMVTANAASVSLVNASFEAAPTTPKGADGFGNYNYNEATDIDGWSLATTGHAYSDALVRDGFSSITGYDGNQAIWLGSSFGDAAGVSQITSSSISAGTYTFNVASASTSTTADSYVINITDGNGTVLASQLNAFAGQDYALTDKVAVSYVADGSEIGNIGVSIVAIDDASTPDNIMVFDNARLDFVAAVPEPSSTALLGLGGLTLMMRRRK